MKYGMLIDLTRCTNCFGCVVACKQYFNTRDGVDYNQGRTIEYVTAQSSPGLPKAHTRYVSTMCNHCEDSPCHKVCPTGATTIAPEGPVLTNDSKCIGCGACVKACPYGQRFLTETSPGSYKAEKCTLCQDKLKRGEEPVCVALCPAKARIFGDLENPESEINYYIRLYGAYKITGTRVYYTVPDGYPVSQLPQPLEYIPKDSDERSATDGLIKARDWIRRNNNTPPAEYPDAEYKYSHCVMCNHVPRCGVKALVKDGKIIRLERREEYGNETLCPMGLAQVQDIEAPDRLLYPLRRVNPKGEKSVWKRITWE